jgi:hypothetical protein
MRKLFSGSVLLLPAPLAADEGTPIIPATSTHPVNVMSTASALVQVIFS